MTVISLGILDCDELAPELRADYDCYHAMFKSLLQFASSTINFRRYHVLAGELPTSVDACDAYLVTGSKTGVYDNEAWLPALRVFLASAYDADKRLLGICFGHQLLADVLGGKAQKSSKGWGVGALTHQQVEVPEWMQPAPHALTLLFSHQDQVTQLPASAQLLYGSDFCPFGAFYIPQRVLSFQGHPEFTKDYSQRLMTIRQSRYAEGQYQQGVDSLKQTIDDEQVAHWMVDFITGRDAS